jgi:hypothetical protein
LVKKTLIPVNLAHADMTANQRAKFKIDLGDKLEVQKRMRSIIYDVKFIDAQAILCDSPSTNYGLCKPFDNDGMPKSYDGGHLTKFGAIYYGLGIKNELICMIFNECR